MSKAFTSESNDEEFPIELAPLPPGTRNYMTADGAARMRAELETLQTEFKSIQPDEVDRQPRASAIARRVNYLNQRLDVAEIIDPSRQAQDRVQFGAIVTFQNSAGDQQTWQIVGIDEADLDQGRLSWTSPLATALLEAQVGETRNFLKNQFKITSIRY